jgi:putative intracellular protease/amidase
MNTVKKTVLFVVLEQYADWEIPYVSTWLLALGQGKYDIKTVSLTKEPVKSLGGLTVLPDYDIQTAPTDYEGLILIGGMSWRKEEAKQVKSLALSARDNKKLLAGICDASAFLGTIGVLNDVDHTSNNLDDLKKWAGNAYTGESKYKMQPAVSDNRIITANGTAPLEFAKEVLLALEVATENKIMEWYNFYKLGIYNANMPSF